MKASLLRLMVLFVSASAGFAQITVQNFWRLGENDPGAGDGVTTNATTVNVSNPTYALNKEDGPQYYRADTPSASLLRFGPSTLSADFNGTGTWGGYYIGINTTTPYMPIYDEYFGLEAWIKTANTDAGDRVILTVGDQDSGYAIMQNGATIEVRFGTGNDYNNGTDTVPVITSSSLTAGTWTHVALVADNATATLYVNGTGVGSYATAGMPGWGSTEYFGVGTQPRSPGGDNFIGLIDEVRYFQYNSSTGFNPGMLNYATAVPEPGTYAAWAGLAVLGLAALRRRRQQKARA